MSQIRSEGAPIQSNDPRLSTGHTVGSGEDRMEHEIELTDPIPKTPHDLPLSEGHTPGSDEGSMTLTELTDLCTTLLQKVLDLENVKTAQAKEIASLKKRVIVEDNGSGEKGCTTVETVSTARPDISAARPEIDADHELAARLTYKEQEKYTVEERSKLLAEFFERKKKQLAKQRAEAIRSKPPTKTQLRNDMC
uniref:Uncharacterized protein n=1 Tax=Tanacetum cinerariifolium TaxID=118510 RepID=A0A699IK43_TANCI|nr:hypothetical protein [Tanacetum cinerariifolium]